MGKNDKKNPKGKKSLSIKDMPPKPKGGAAIKGGAKHAGEIHIES